MMLICPSKECKHNTEEDGCKFEGIILLTPADYSIKCEAYEIENKNR